MSDSKFVNKALHHSTPHHETFAARHDSGAVGVGIHRLNRCTADELLARTLPYALRRGKDVGPLAAWMRFFAETEP